MLESLGFTSGLSLPLGIITTLVNDPPNLLVPKAKPKDTNSISYYYFKSTNVPNHLLMIITSV